MGRNTVSNDEFEMNLSQDITVSAYKQYKNESNFALMPFKVMVM